MPVSHASASDKGGPPTSKCDLIVECPWTLSRYGYRPFPPHPSWTAFKLRSKGSLAVSEGRAIFSPKSGDAVVIENVMKVTKGWKNSVNGTWLPPVVDTYIEVIYGDRASPSAAFLNDGRWLGLATFLPHRRLMRSLKKLIAVT